MKKIFCFILVFCMTIMVGCAVIEPPTSGVVNISLSETTALDGDLEVVILNQDRVEISTYLEASSGYKKTIDLAFGEYTIQTVKNINNKDITYEVAPISFVISKDILERDIILNISTDVNIEEETNEDIQKESSEVVEEFVPIDPEPEFTEDILPEEEVEEKTPFDEISDIIEETEVEVNEEEIVTEPTQSFKDVHETVWVTEAVNIRIEPNTNCDILGVFSVGDELLRIGESDEGWSKISYKDGVAYCSSSYLTTKEPKNETIFPIVYEDETAKITITKEWYENAWAYIAHLEFSDYTRFGTSVSNGKYENGYETTSHAAKRLGAIFAVNGCYSAPKLNYVVVRDGVIWNRPESTLNLPAIYSSHNGLFSNAWDNSRPEELKGGQTIQELVDAGLMTDSFCFGPPMLIDGEILAENNYDRAQRTFIGTNGNPGDIWIVVSDGRKNDGESSGLNYYQCGKLLLDKGCSFGICLDGGGSSTMVFDGKILNANGANERAVVDFVYFK